MPTMNTTGATCSASTDCKPDKENIFYFKSRFSHYTLRRTASDANPCTYEYCYVLLNSTNASVQLSNVDVLVFADQELRP